MSAFGTKKQGADFAQQLTFPTVFSEVVAEAGANPYGYMPQSMRPATPLPVGDDLQDKYHQQKMMDAHRRVMNAVADNRASTARFLKSHQNYILPKPVLSQRQFANPSNGNQADIYSHRPIQWEVNWDNLYGGVLFTQKAQKWGRQKLQDRIGQLDAIQQAKQEFLTGTPMVDATAGVPSGVEEFPIGSKVELVAILQTIATSVDAGKVSALTLGDSVKFLRLLFRWATSASLDDLEEVFEYVDAIIVDLDAIEDQFQEGVAEGVPDVREYNNQLLETMRRVRQYLKGMIGAVNRPPKERQKVSLSLIKSAGFTSLMRKSVEVLQREEEQKSAFASRKAVRDWKKEADRLGIEWRNMSKSRQAEIKKSIEEMGASEEFGMLFDEKAQSDADVLKWLMNGDDEKFDKAPRERLADESGDYLGEEKEASSSSTTNRFRETMKSAELPVEEAKAAEPAFSEVKSRPAEPASQDARNWRPQWLTREVVNSATSNELIQLAMKANQEGRALFGRNFKPYEPNPNSKRTSIKRGMMDRWNL